MVVDFNEERILYSLVASQTHDGKVGEYIVLIYSDGTNESARMSLFDASRLAEDQGLSLVPTSDEIFRWVRA